MFATVGVFSRGEDAARVRHDLAPVVLLCS